MGLFPGLEAEDMKEEMKEDTKEGVARVGRRFSVASVQDLYDAYLAELANESEEVVCSITGESSKTEDRTINLAMVGTGTGNGAEEAITSCDGIRQYVFGGGGGGGDTRRVAIFAHAGAGKSWMMAQLKRKWHRSCSFPPGH